MSKTEKARWQYRFDNFERAYGLLREAITLAAARDLTQLEKEGLIQRFEFTIELAWKTLKDYLESQNVALTQVTPRAVIREAFAARILTDGELWMDALDARNRMAHTYDRRQFEAVIEAIRLRYLDAIEALYLRLRPADPSIDL
ncbi:MAG: nucleotidyltransferase substrate binding protein [Vampirovibrionales bacterium]|nr:nucleotidyltransferase substrate binding protein [Vampirovibrionales bacterium]